LILRRRRTRRRRKLPLPETFGHGRPAPQRPVGRMILRAVRVVRRLRNINFPRPI
jgi:hypothetical protein